MEELFQIAGYLVSVASAAAIVMGIETLNGNFSTTPSAARQSDGMLTVAVNPRPAPLQRPRS